MYWKKICKSDHYLANHSNMLSWHEVIRLIYLIKNKRRKGDCIVVENDRVYIMCKIKDKILYVVNAKPK